MTNAIRWTPERYAEYMVQRAEKAQTYADRILGVVDAPVAPPAAPAHAAEPKKAKYGNTKIEADGQTFDSKREYRRWLVLVDMQRRGEISDLQRQIPFELIPAQRCDNGKTERACSYVADFGYVQDGQPVVEDSKGMKTKDYVIKRKLLLYVHGITIKET